MFLSVSPGSGKCFACQKSFLPCENSLLGCSRHVQHNPLSRKRYCCSHHNHVQCSFAASSAFRRCSSNSCGNSRDSLEDSLCSTCRKGFLSCIERCSRRTASSSAPRCLLCSADSGTEYDGDTHLGTNEQSEAVQQCTTKGCATLVLWRNGELTYTAKFAYGAL